MTQAHDASVAITPEAPVTLADLALAFGSVGAGLVSVAVFIDGLMSIDHAPDARLWAIGGLLAYLAVWGWGIRFARRS